MMTSLNTQNAREYRHAARGSRSGIRGIIAHCPHGGRSIRLLVVAVAIFAGTLSVATPASAVERPTGPGGYRCHSWIFIDGQAKPLCPPLATTHTVVSVQRWRQIITRGH